MRVEDGIESKLGAVVSNCNVEAPPAGVLAHDDRWGPKTTREAAAQISHEHVFSDAEPLACLLELRNASNDGQSRGAVWSGWRGMQVREVLFSFIRERRGVGALARRNEAVWVRRAERLDSESPAELCVGTERRVESLDFGVRVERRRAVVLIETVSARILAELRARDVRVAGLFGQHFENDPVLALRVS